jgi:sigma-E factor negative regulatory protein RseA
MERISAFMDGESARTEAQHAMLHLKQNDECCEVWATFHLIGDMMRGTPVLRDDFVTRFRAQMEHEPTQLAPRMSRVKWKKSISYALSAAASLGAIAFVLTVALSDNTLRPQAPIAVAPKAVETMVARAVAQPADPRPTAAISQHPVNEYLMAHQEYSPSNAFQGVAPYVRTVSESHDGIGH